jgi:hypothetical protein
MIKKLLPWTLQKKKKKKKKKKKNKNTKGVAGFNKITPKGTHIARKRVPQVVACHDGRGWLGFTLDLPFTNDDWAFHQCY